jgi:cytochrome c oxidase cbb3-type subunit 1
LTTAETPAPLPGGQLVLERLVFWYFVVGLGYMAVSLVGGLIMSLQLLNHNFLRGIELFSPGRWRMLHTNAISQLWRAFAPSAQHSPARRLKRAEAAKDTR